MKAEASIVETTFPNSTHTFLKTAYAFSLLVLALPITVQAQFIYMTNQGNIIITRYNGSNATVTIPSTINGLPVVSIGNNAFFGDPKLTSVSIPYGVTNVGQVAFYSCSNLTSVTIPTSVTAMGDWLFYADANLPRVTIPSGVARIGDRTFQHCANLTGVYFKGSAPLLRSDSVLLGHQCDAVLLAGSHRLGSDYCRSSDRLMAATGGNG